MARECQFCTYVSRWGGTSGSFLLAAVLGHLGSVGVSQAEERWSRARGMGREGDGGVVPAAPRRISGIVLRGLHFQFPVRLTQSPVAVELRRPAAAVEPRLPAAAEPRRSAEVSARGPVRAPFPSCGPGPEADLEALVGDAWCDTGGRGREAEEPQWRTRRWLGAGRTREAQVSFVCSGD